MDRFTHALANGEANLVDLLIRLGRVGGRRNGESIDLPVNHIIILNQVGQGLLLLFAELVLAQLLALNLLLKRELKGGQPVPQLMVEKK